MPAVFTADIQRQKVMQTIYEKSERFWRRVEAANLGRAAEKISDIASAMLGDCLEDVISEHLEKQQFRPVCRIRYQPCNNKTKESERYIFETQTSEGEPFSFLFSAEVRNDMIHYTALTQIRELIRQGYNIHFE